MGPAPDRPFKTFEKLLTEENEKFVFKYDVQWDIHERNHTILSFTVESSIDKLSCVCSRTRQLGSGFGNKGLGFCIRNCWCIYVYGAYGLLGSFKFSVLCPICTHLKSNSITL